MTAVPSPRALVTALLLTGLLVSCGGNAPSTPADEPPAAAPAAEPIDPATVAAIEGTITFDGTAPKPAPINMSSDPYCQGQGAAATQAVLVDGKNGLQNVFVYVKDGLGNRVFPVPQAPVVLDQHHCQYNPRVFGIQAGQPLEIRNSDDTLHNIHARPAQNREFNRGQGSAGMTHTHVFTAPEVMVPFKCDVHRWMNAWVGVLPHPYYAVSAADGTFSLRGLPPGTYTIEAWHETLGTRTETVTIGPSATGRVSFHFSA